MNHGSPMAAERHVGDLGNIMTSEDGVTKIDIVDLFISLDSASPNSVLDRAFVVHEMPDDLGLGGDAGSAATGNAGARLACGIIVEMMPCK